MSAPLTKRIEEIEKRIEEESKDGQNDGIWLFWNNTIALQKYADAALQTFQPVPELTDDLRAELTLRWIAGQTFTPGDAYGVCFEYGFDKEPSWRLYASPAFKPRWTDGAEFLSMKYLAEVKEAMSDEVDAIQGAA